MAGDKRGQVSMMRDGVKYVGYYTVENDVVKVSTETGTLSRPTRGMPAQEVAAQLLAKLVNDEIRSLR